jgi:UMF1 family MFS transporter
MPPSPTPEQVIAVGQMASRWGIASILILFIAGAVLFYFVDEDKGREQAALLE